MFKKVMDSELKCYNEKIFYKSNFRHNYPYKKRGPFHSSTQYKNTAAYYLTCINLIKKDYKEAYRYACLASTKYSNGPSCGTSYQFYESNMDGLMFECLFNLGKYQTILDNYFEHYFFCKNEKLTNVLLKIYTPEQLRDSMNAAISTIRYTISDTGTYTRYSNIEISYGVSQSISSTIFFMRHQTN